MTATTPDPLAGSQAPSQIEYLYERYRHLLKWVLILVIAGFGINEFFKWQRQSQINAVWSGFATTLGLDETYTDKEAQLEALTDHLADKDLAAMEQALAAADSVRAPFLLLAVARKAMLLRDWDRASSALDELEAKYPDHPFVVENPYPIQIRDEVEKEEEVDAAANPRKKPEYEPAKKGSLVGMMRAQITSAKQYVRPPQFAKPEIPADAPRVKFTMSGDYGSFTIALMPQAPKHKEKFLELVSAPEGGFWKGLNVDEVQRGGSSAFKRPMQFHLGFTTTREPDRSKWTKTDPSENQVEFEETGLSHFPGAVAARVEADGKSCADRFYVCAEDNAMQDGSRVVFGYVVEGLENIELICEAALANEQEEAAGFGVPIDNITVESVELVQ